MKLTGEYELTDDGVVIEGVIHNSKIHDVRALFKPFTETRMYCGEKPKYSESEVPLSYNVPHPSYRSYIRRAVPGVITPERDHPFVKVGVLTQNNETHYADAQQFTQSMGIMYGNGEGRDIMTQKTVMSYSSMRRNKLKLITNSAWVWNTKRDGSFKIELQGLVNRHMMTCVLANATKLAKYIDEVLARTLDYPEKFTEEAIIEGGRVRSNLYAQPDFVSFLNTIEQVRSIRPIAGFRTGNVNPGG